VPAVTARGGWVVNVPDYCVEEVSDHVVAMLLDFWRGITKFDLEVKRGRLFCSLPSQSDLALRRVLDRISLFAESPGTSRESILEI
jgi:lactate dehydrogenase-like 2-hydroxyacid dehydrogenase